jgi:hypothetical protein
VLTTQDRLGSLGLCPQLERRTYGWVDLAYRVVEGVRYVERVLGPE